MEKGKSLGPQKTAASILFLWGVLYSLAEMMVVNGSGSGSITMSAAGWVSQLCSLGIIVLLFIGKSNIAFGIIWGLKALISIRYALVAIGINSLIWFAAEAAMLVLIIFDVLPSFSGRKNPFKNLEFIPACLHLLPYIFILISDQSYFGAMYFINATIGSLAWWLMARALTSKNVQQGADTASANAYSTSIRYAPPAQAGQQQAVRGAAASADSGPGVLLVRFSIDKLNQLSGSYGFQSGKLLGKAVPPHLLEGMTISDGDSAATLRGSEYVCIVSISTASNRSVLCESVEPLILASEDIKACGGFPLTQIVSSTSEPLVVDGIVRNGKIEGSGGWCASGFMSAWKEEKEKRPLPGAAPVNDNPAAAITPQNKGYAPSYPQAGLPIQNRFCMHCGKPLMAGGAFCGACGTAVNVSAEPMPLQKAAPQDEAITQQVTPQSEAAAPQQEACKRKNAFYAFAVQGPAFGMAGAGDIMQEKAQALKDGYQPAKDMELKIIRPGQWNANINSSNSGGVISVSYNFAAFKKEIREYLLKEGVLAETIEKGIRLCEENSLQLSNPMSGVFVMGVPIVFESGMEN